MGMRVRHVGGLIAEGRTQAIAGGVLDRVDHPLNVTLRQDTLFEPLDAWLASRSSHVTCPQPLTNSPQRPAAGIPRGTRSTPRVRGLLGRDVERQGADHRLIHHAMRLGSARPQRRRGSAP